MYSFAGESQQGAAKDKRLDPGGHVRPGTLLQQVVLEEEPDLVSSEILLTHGCDLMLPFAVLLI